MNKYIVTFSLLLCILLFGCKGIGKNQNNLYTQAEVIRENSKAIQAEAREVMVQTEVIAEQVQIADNAIRGVLESQGTIDAPNVSERLGVALGANQSILAARTEINTKVHQIDQIAGVNTQAANAVTKSAGRVEDVPSFWERLTTSVRRLILIALGLVIVVIGWRFGLDKLVKSILNTISNGINTASDWAYAKYQGPAKLIREGKMEEAIAALRATIPGLDKSFRSRDNAGGSDAG